LSWQIGVAFYWWTNLTEQGAMTDGVAQMDTQSVNVLLAFVENKSNLHDNHNV